MGKRIHKSICVDSDMKKKLKLRLCSEGKSLQGAILDEAYSIVNNGLSIETPIERFSHIRKQLIDKYGTLKNAAERVGMNPGMLSNTLHFLETKKNYRPSKSTMSKLSELLEK